MASYPPTNSLCINFFVTAINKIYPCAIADSVSNADAAARESNKNNKNAHTSV